MSGPDPPAGLGAWVDVRRAPVRGLRPSWTRAAVALRTTLAGVSRRCGTASTGMRFSRGARHRVRSTRGCRNGSPSWMWCVPASGSSLERVAKVVFGDAPAEVHARDARPAVMETSPQAGTDDLVSEVVRPREVVDGVQIARRAARVEAVDVDVDPVGPEELREDLRERRGHRPVRGRVLGMVRGDDQGPPASLLCGRGVAVV